MQLPPLLPGPDWESDPVSLLEYGAAIALLAWCCWYGWTHRDTLPESHRDTLPESHRDTPPESHRDTPPESHRDTPPESHRDRD